MGGWTGFLFTYLLGGLTFIPLVVVTVLVHAHLTFPYREDVNEPPISPSDDIVQPGDDVVAIKAARQLHKEEVKSRSAAQDVEVASGYFAVCREYTPMGINAKPIERSTPVGSTTVAAPSQSVYQSMYRSIFDRKQAPGPLDTNSSTGLRPKKAGNVFYVVLRHGHLMLFDDDEQLEVRHVVSLAHHDISIYSGGDVTPEGELFIKRNALCLARKTDTTEVAPDTHITKPFYLFSDDCSLKEDFYFALLRNQTQALASEQGPTPLGFDVKNIISLVQKLHSSEEYMQTRWLNAMVGRVFLGIHRTADIENFIREKLTKKISRVKRPSFLSDIKIRRIETGDAAPYFTNPRLKDLTVEGECGVECDVKYTGNCRVEVSATAKIDLGTRFKVREVPLVLAVVLKRVEGHVLFKIKPPPSNRMWLSFAQMPKMEMAIEPIVSSRQITYTVILRQIEHRIKEVIAESVVLPFWDDVPFFRTEHKKWRGGIFAGDDAVESSFDFETTAAQVGDVDEVDRYEEGALNENGIHGLEKSYSMPSGESGSPTTGLFGRRLNGKLHGHTKGSASSSSFDAKPYATGHQDERSGSFPTLSPPEPASPAKATKHGDGDSSPTHSTIGSILKSSGLSKKSSVSSASSREGTDSERDAKLPATSPPSQPAPATHDPDAVDQRSSEVSSISGKSSLKSHTGSLSRNFFLRRENSASSTATSTNSQQDTKRNTLAAVANAAVSARRWGLNALQRHTDGAHGHQSQGTDGEQEGRVDLNQPMGRGQPLPPPGVPLPMPDRKKATPATKRKPIAPPPLPDRGHGFEEADQKAPRRAIPPPPLPKRRQASIDASKQDTGENLLVISAPEDSAPASPLSESAPGGGTGWHPTTVEDEKSADAADEPEQMTPPGSKMDVALPGSSQTPSDNYYTADAEKHGTAQDGEDDDISAWMGDVEEEAASHVAAPRIEGEVR